MTIPTLDPLPQTLRYQEKREAILAAAATLFNEHGLKGATLTGIAASVGLVTNSVTYYYRKKEDLAGACLLRAIEVYDAMAGEALEAGGVRERIASFMRLNAALMAEIDSGRRPELLTFNDIRAMQPAQAEQVFPTYNQMFRRVRALLQGEETAALARDDLNARAHMLLSMSTWMRPWLGYSYEPEDYPRVIDRLSDVMIGGIAAASSRWGTLDGEEGWHVAAAVAGPGDAFLRAATLMVNEQGYRGASVDRISAQLNVTKGSFYHHNDTKQDLIAQCFERTFAAMRRALQLAEAAPGSGWSRASAAARAMVRYQLSPDGPLLRFTATSALPDQAHRERVRATMRRIGGHLQMLLSDGIADGSVRPVDAAIASQYVLSSVNAAAELQRWVRGATMENGAALFVRPMFEGLLCPGVQAAATG